ncbi:unnamed protein product [Caenorhabditis angaria]|uniref:Fungal lipase-type domain-containing protein n=1 Tax=Caenorhabditis angaria TaxID=860376 RepID=A0A9P1IJE7_9PELO|nr:unnamed protein product [Caenorhabditis angaria]
MCLDLIFANYSVATHSVVACDQTDGTTSCGSLVVVAHDVKAVVVAFRGTKGKTQFLVETNVLAFIDPVSWPPGGKVGAYFFRAFNDLWDSGVGEILEKVLEDYPDYELWIGGHSLGGSLGTLTANLIDSEIEYSFRIVNKRDVIVHLPPKGYRGARHHGREIWYKNGMLASTSSNFLQCNNQESKNCSEGLKVFYRYKDHHKYFGIYMTTWGRRNCQGD